MWKSCSLYVVPSMSFIAGAFHVCIIWFFYSPRFFTGLFVEDPFDLMGFCSCLSLVLDLWVYLEYDIKCIYERSAPSDSQVHALRNLWFFRDIFGGSICDRRGWNYCFCHAVNQFRENKDKEKSKTNLCELNTILFHMFGWSSVSMVASLGTWGIQKSGYN